MPAGAGGKSQELSIKTRDSNSATLHFRESRFLQEIKDEHVMMQNIVYKT
jgi:hypothetical protein